MYVYFLQTFALCHLQKCIEMGIMTVYAAVRKQSIKMKGRIILLRILHSSQKCFILEEITILNLFGNSGQLLIYDAASAHIHMSYLGVTHLSVWKTYCQSTGISLYKRIFFHQLIHYRGSCLRNGISIFSVIQSITVQNHQHCWFFTHSFISFIIYL